MTSAAEALQSGDIRYYAPHHGKVIDNADPDGLHRVRVTIPGLLEKSQWAFPMTAGGGAPQRGGHITPDIDADVVVWFIGGDVEFPIYTSGWWGLPEAGSEMPDPAKDAGADAHKVQTLQLLGGRLVITVDEREDTLIVSVADNKSGDFVAWDFKNYGLSINLSAAMIIKVAGVFDVEATQINLNGRKVLPDNKAM